MKLVIKNSSVLENGAAKPVTVAQMEFGEIALNYNTVDPTIFFKDSTNVIRGVRLGIQADITDTNNQPGTYDDRYLRADVSSTVAGSITAQNFIGGVSRIGPNPPTANSAGELWYNTNDGRLYIYYEDVDSGQWVDAAPDTYEFAENYYTKSETNSLFAYNSGDTFTGTVNFDGTATSSIVSTTSVNGVTFSSYTADGNHFSLSAGFGTTGDQGYRVLNTGTFESYTPQSSDGTAIKAFRVFQGTTENAFITAAGAGAFTSVSGDGSNISALSGSVVKAAIEAEPDINVFSDSDATKLDGIELGAQVNTVTSVNGLTGDVEVNVNDDEGTFTPVWSSGFDAPVYQDQAGTYYKIGKLVHFSLKIAFGSMPSSNVNSDGLKIGNLPYSAHSSNEYMAGCLICKSNYGGEFDNIHLSIEPGTNEICFYDDATEVAADSMSHNNKYIVVSGTYMAASA